MSSKVRVAYLNSNQGRFYSGREALDELLVRLKYIQTKYGIISPPAERKTLLQTVLDKLACIPTSRLGGDEIWIIREPIRNKKRNSRYLKVMQTYRPRLAEPIRGPGRFFRVHNVNVREVAIAAAHRRIEEREIMAAQEDPDRPRDWMPEPLPIFGDEPDNEVEPL